jgi:D-glycero-alpha-D-manno-heptose 1-phosphate guanylyltransferase
LEVSGDRLLGFRQRSVAGFGLINAGCYLLPVNLVEIMPHKALFSFETDVLYHDVKTHPYRVVEVDGAFIDIGIPEDYARAQGLLDRYC